MNKTTLKGSMGDIKNFEVLTTSTVFKHTSDGNVSMRTVPAVLSISQYESRPDVPILSISQGGTTIILEFNSDFPLLFEEGIKLWK